MIPRSQRAATSPGPWLVALALLCAAASPAWGAASFTPIKPPACSAPKEIPYSYSVWGPTNIFELPTDPNCVSTPGNACPHYINHLMHTRMYLANPWTDTASLLLGDVNLEPGYDELHFSTDDSHYTGVWSNQWQRVITQIDGSFGFLDFKADYSVTYPGFHIDKARVCTNLTQQRSLSYLPYLAYPDRGVGFLQGTNDVIYLMVDHPKDHLSIAVWAQGTLDTDLYVGCSAVPTITRYSYASKTTTANGQEYLDIPSSCKAAGGAYAYVAVHSRSGSGAFNIALSPHLAAGHRTVTVNKNWTGTPDNNAQWKTTLAEAARRVFAATEGNVIIDEFKLYKGPHCEICGQKMCAHCYKNICCGAANYPGYWPPYYQHPEWENRCFWWSETLNDVWFDAKTTAHELLHEYYCVQDEYINGLAGDTQCGHSIMANQWGDRQYNLCVPLDHATDYNPSCGPSPNLSSHELAYNAGLSSGVVSYDHTSDNYDYSDFDFTHFTSQIGKVTDTTNTATLVVGNTTLSAGDNVLKTQLTNWGFTVTAVRDSSVTASSVANASLVVVSSTVNSGNVNTKLRDVAVPVVCLQSSLFDDFKMTGTTSSDFGTASSQTDVAEVTGATLAGGLTGSQTVTSAASTFGWGKPVSFTYVGAWINGATGSKAASFGYIKGDAMAGGMVAPARRVGFFLTDSAATKLNTNGTNMLLWAVIWATLVSWE